MNPPIKDRYLTVSGISFRKRSAARMAFFLLGVILTSFAAQAESVTINLGQTAENFTMAGTGANGSGLGTYIITMGACSASAGNTTCTLSGSFTGTTSGFTSGTYSLVTTYVGTGSTPFRGVEQAAGSNYFSFSSAPSTSTMTLYLTTSTGTVSAPMLVNGSFVSGATFSLIYTSPTCSGTPVASCSVSQVGVTSGSSITGQVTGSAGFVETSQTYYFSQLAFSAGWQTTLTFVNYSPQTVTCQTSFYGDSGSPLAVPFNQGTITTRTDVLAPGGVIHDQTVASLTASTQEGWAEATCSGPVQASLLYRYYQSGVPSGEASVNAETAPTTEFATFAQTATGVAYGNPSPTEPANVTLTVFNTAGVKLGSTTVQLVPMGHGSGNLGPLLGLQSFVGFVEVTATAPILSLSINAEVFPVFSSLPPGDLPASTTLVQ